MAGSNDIEMNDGIRISGSSETEDQFFQAAESQPSGGNSTPSWVRSILSLLAQLLTFQQKVQRDSISSEDLRPRHSQPHPEKFSGIDASSYPQFRSLLEAKLKIDAKAIGNEEEKVWYAYGRLSDTALQRIHPWVEFTKHTEKFTVEEFFSRLDKAYGDPEKRTKAINKLNSMRQGNREFREFLQDFEQTLLEAQAWGWSDEAKKGYLRAGLNRDLCDRLVSQDEPRDYDDFVSQLRTTSDKMQSIKNWDNQRFRGRHIPPSPINESQSAGDPMDWEPTQSINIAAAYPNSSGQRYQTPRARSVWVSHEEIGRRISEGLCIRCGGQSHVIKNCQFLPALNPNRPKRFQPQQARVSAGVVPTEQNNVNSQEKEKPLA